MKSNGILWVLSATLLLGLPLLGAALNGADLPTYMEFPPLTRYVPHAPFNATAFVVIATVDILMALGILWLFRGAFRRSSTETPIRQKHYAFPSWGWLGTAVTAAGWILAWTRYPWFEPLQAYTFCIPWIGYIMIVNGLCIWRSGESLLTHATGRFLALWPASALFWWFFEYLNRFVQNWYYVGVDDFSPGQYALHASLAFSTVLPAVLSTHRLLLTFPALHSGLKPMAEWSLVDDRRTALIILAVSGIGLALIGKFSDYLYPLVWSAPLLVITALQSLFGKPNLLSGLKIGDWRALVASAAAALICGFFWEMWNYYSLARWEYSIPFVDRFHIFAMPLLGYGGYFPFGLECLLVGQIVMGDNPLKLPAG